MEELRKCYKKLDELMKEIENRHDTDIMDFINLDEEVKAEYMGDWTDRPLGDNPESGSGFLMCLCIWIRAENRSSCWCIILNASGKKRNKRTS